MNKKLKILSAALLISSAEVLSAMDDAAAAAIATPPGGAAIARLPLSHVLAGTDTELLIKCMQSGDMQPYFVHEKVDAKAKMNTFVNLLLDANGPFLDAKVKFGGPGLPVDNTRDAFKAAIDAFIDSVNLTTAAPANATLSALASCHASVQSEISMALEAYIDTLLVANGRFLDAKVKFGGAGLPADDTRNAFKAAMSTFIF